MKKYYFLGGVFAVILIVSAFAFNSNKALGNQSSFTPNSGCRTAVATSTLSVMVASTSANITLVCDAYNIDTYNVNPVAIDSAVLGVQYTVASTTGSSMSIVISYSDDGIDYYKNYLISPDAIATTSVTLANSTTTVVKYLFNVLTPTRYIKATFANAAQYVATSSVWAQFVPKREVRY